MSRQRRMLSLCGFIIIVSLLQGSVADSFSSVFSNCSVGMSNQSKGCTSLPTDVLGAFGIEHALTNFDYRSAIVYILVDLIPLMVYFPLLILFNFNLASGPAQSFCLPVSDMIEMSGVCCHSNQSFHPINSITSHYSYPRTTCKEHPEIRTPH